jgi:hypothetical protein
MDVKCQHCGALHWLAEKTANSSQSNPQFGACCNHGKVVIENLAEPPEGIRRLLLDDTDQAKDYRNNMWQYNIALSFTSLGVTEDQSVSRGRGPPIFKIQGELVHRAGALVPSPGRTPTMLNCISMSLALPLITE